MKYIFILFVQLIVRFIAFSQEEEKGPIRILKSPDGYMYTDNTKRSYFCIDFKGDSLKNSGVENGYDIDGRFYQVIKNTYDQDEYDNIKDSVQEIKLLKSKMESELDYLSKEVLNKTLESGYEVFKNKDGKNYFLWHYISPLARSKDTSITMVTMQYILTFVANQYVVGVTTPVFEGENKEDRKKELKQLADRIDVLGNRIDLEGLYYKLDALADGKELEYVDSANKYTLTIPEWFNILETSDESIYIGTLPDIYNIQNAIAVRRFGKTSFASFNEFNEKLVSPSLKIGDKFVSGTLLLKKELPKPSIVTGISYKLTIQTAGGNIFENHYTTLETGNCYLLVLFTATPETFSLNHPRFLEFIEKIVVIK